MADDAVHSPGPVSSLGGFAGRAPADPQRRPPAREGAIALPAVDSVSIHAAAVIAGALLRERVLAGTRRLLRLGGGAVGPEFAELLEGEPVGTFLGRLLSAQNQLAAHAPAHWPEQRLRRCLDRALQAGANETLELLAGDERADAAGVLWVGEVLVEYGRRLAALAGTDDASGAG